MKKLKLIVLFLLTVLVTQAQRKYELTVKEAVDLAFANVIDVKNAQVDYDIQKAQNNEITGLAYPQITGSVQANHYLKLPAILFPNATSTAVYQILKNEGVSGTNGPITNVPDPTTSEVSFQQPWNLAAGATLTQLLFEPDVFVGLQARKTALGLSSARLEEVKEKVKDSAYKKYYAVLIVQKQLDLLEVGLNRLRKLYHDDSLMFVNGFAERLDLDKVQVQLNNLTTQRNMVANAIDLSMASIKFSLGLSQQDTVVLKEDLSTANIRENLLDNNFRYEDRPEIRTLGYARKMQELDVKRYKLGFVPTVSAVGNYSYNGMGQHFYSNSSTIWINSSFVGLNMNIPIFDGFQRKYKTEQARLKLKQVDNNIVNMKQVIDLQQVAAKDVLVTNLNNLDIQEKNMDLAEKVFNATAKKQQAGVGSSFEVIQSELDLQTAQSNYFTALYNAVIAKISYLQSLGRLQ
ncbi:MAG: TolC family protein [Flavisolibacter sp.]